MDMRTHGKEFERFYANAKDRHGMRFIRSRVPVIDMVEGNHDLIIPYTNKHEAAVQEAFDMVVLSVGLRVSPDVAALAERLNIDLTGRAVLPDLIFSTGREHQKRSSSCAALFKVRRIFPSR